jgi:hypothetical protein
MKTLYNMLTIIFVSTVIFRYKLDEEDPSSGPAPLSICPKCGRLVNDRWSLVKDQTSFDDILDSFQMSCLNYHRTKRANEAIMDSR